MRAEWSLSTMRELAYRAERDGMYIEGMEADRGLVVCTGRMRNIDPGVGIITGIAGSWYRAGLPRVCPSFAALQRLTRTAPERKPVEPWRCWVIELPRGHAELPLIGRDGSTDQIRVVIVINLERWWNFVALGARVEYMLIGRTAEQLRDGWDDGLNCVPEHERIAMSDVDHASVRKMQYLVLGAASALGEIEGVRRMGAERGARDKGRYPAGDYELT